MYESIDTSFTTIDLVIPNVVLDNPLFAALPYTPPLPTENTLFFQNRFIIGNLKVIAQLIIVVDLQINQCKFSINLLAFSL